MACDTIVPPPASSSRAAAERRAGAGPALAVFLPNLDGGGAERALLHLASGLSQRGFRTDLVLANAAGPYLPLVPKSVRRVDLGVSRVAGALRPLAAYLRRERPSALLAALNHANLVAMAASRMPGARTRIVISIQNTLGKERRATVRDRAIPWLLGRFHRWADAIVAVSEGVADDFARTTGIPRDCVQVIYNPVITPSLLPAASEPPAHPWFEDVSRPVVLGAGRLVPQKNFSLLIEAFALVKRRHDARLIILGEGPERTALEEQVRRCGCEDSIVLPGFVDNPFACMARAAVFVLSSDFEGLPTVLIESLAVGTPVVSTDCESGPREILRGGALGDLVSVGDVSAMADAISRVLSEKRAAPSPDVLRPFTLGEVLNRFQVALNLDA